MNQPLPKRMQLNNGKPGDDDPSVNGYETPGSATSYDLPKKLKKLPEIAKMDYIAHCDVCPFFDDGSNYEYNASCNLTGTIISKFVKVEGEDRPVIPKDCLLEDY